MILGLIPSRLNSSRLKNKPLLNIDGLPLVIHTLKRALMAKKLDKVFVCTDSHKIINEVRKHGGEALMTSKKHRNGTERIYEVAKKYKCKLVIDIQGDEPLVDPKDIDKVINFHLNNNHFDIVVPSMITKDPNPKNIVKVVFDKNNRILYFSRSVVPFNYSNDKNFIYYKDLSIVSFKPNSLKKFAESEMGKIEKQEGIELIRALENKMNLGTFVSKSSSFSVDVNNDLLKAIDAMPKNKYRKFY
jgi:3-deoxy-manno-octulosonate cytidylyltransferase (CMP-KDO synthetase)